MNPGTFVVLRRTANGVTIIWQRGETQLGCAEATREGALRRLAAPGWLVNPLAQLLETRNA